MCTALLPVERLVRDARHHLRRETDVHTHFELSELVWCYYELAFRTGTDHHDATVTDSRKQI